MFLFVLVFLFILIFIGIILLLQRSNNNNDTRKKKKRRSRRRRKKKPSTKNDHDQLLANSYSSYSDQFNNSYNETLKIVSMVLFDNYDTTDSSYDNDSYDTNDDNSSYDNDDNSSYDNDDNSIYDTYDNSSYDTYDNDSYDNDDNDSYGNNKTKSPIVRGDLYQLCPCKGNYVCDRGICKKRTNEICIISSECAGQSLCYKGNCVLKPGEWMSPIAGECQAGLTIVNNHTVILNDNKTEFTLLPGWQIFENSISICLSNRPTRKKGEILLLTKRGLYRVDTKRYVSDIKRVKESTRPFPHISVNDTMFNHDNIIYLIRGSKLYKLHWVNDDSVRWSSTRGKNLNGIELDDGTSLVRNYKKYHLDDSLLKTIIRNSFANRSLHIGNHLDLGINITGNIIQIVKSPTSKDTLICLNKDGTVHIYNYMTNCITPIRGRGKKLLVCNGHVWMISDNKCVNI